jgi:restriction system protein
MPNQEAIEQQQQLLATHRRTLAHWLQQQAQHGTAYAPPAVTHGIRDARAEIARIKDILRNWKVDVEDLPDDGENLDLHIERKQPSSHQEAKSGQSHRSPNENWARWKSDRHAESDTAQSYESPSKQFVNYSEMSFIRSAAETAKRYTVLGVEHVYDAFDEYEHPNAMPPFQVKASSVEEAISKGEKSLQSIITEQRKNLGSLSSGTFIAEIVQILDNTGEVLFQRQEPFAIIAQGFSESYNLISLHSDDIVVIRTMLEEGLDEEYRGFITPKEFCSNSLLIPVNLPLTQYLYSHPDKLKLLNLPQLKELVAEFLSKEGYKILFPIQNEDLDIDIFAEVEREVGLELVLIRCKANQEDRKVGQPVVKQLNADIYDRKATRGLIVTTSYFTKPALDYIEQAKYRLSGADFDKLQLWLDRIRHS